MSQTENIQRLISSHERRLQKLKEKRALLGFNIPSEILIEIEDIEEEIAKLKRELGERESYPFAPSPSTQVTQVTILLDRNLREFTSAEREDFVSTLSSIVNINPNQIQILRVESGSILVTLEMPNDAALKLLSMYLDEAPVLRSLRITKVELHPATGVGSNSENIKILFLAANPLDTGRLRLDEEIRGIDEKIRQSNLRDRFEIIQQWAVRVTDLQGYLLRHNPNIVHFSGHGSKSNEIILEDNVGNSRPVSTRALNGLFSTLKDNIRCVVLNGCYSESQAQAIAQNIDVVIGMSKAISDQTAISFSVAFYQALAFGRDMKTAFDLGCNQIALSGLDEYDVPKLITLQVNPKEITLFGS